jgi:hypothetical protein
VFNDVDHNGYYNTGDVLLDGVTVKAFASGDDPLTASPVAVTVTSGGGLYRLCLRPGSYFLHIPPLDFVSLLSGMYPTLAPATGPVNNLDDNADQNLLPSTKPYAFGCNTGVFTLAVGGAPTAASGETGYQASSDDSYDMNSNLTIDLGFYAFPVASAPLAGRVRRDLTGSGDATATTAPATGVEVALYEDTNANGVLDVTEMTALQTAVTDTAGSYVFDPVLPGDYLVVQALPAGSTATFDTDGGDAACTCVKAEGKPVDGIDFMQTGVADTFAQWQKANTDSDADQYDALMEYALGTSPSGFSRPRFWVEARAEGTADAVVVRQSGGHADINFKLEVSSDLKAWSRSALNPAIAANNDGTETLRFRDLNSPFVRLKVELDADFNGDPEQVSVSPVYGWAERQIPVGQQTFSMPLLRTAVFIGRASEATGRDFASGRHYFAEVISGNDEGRRFEIDEAGSDATHIAYQSGQPAADARIAIRPHWTVGELFPPDRFHGNSSASSADRVMTYDGTAYRTLWLLASDSGNRWVSGDALTAAPEGGTIIGPTEGVMLQPKLVPVKLQLVGEVRTWSLWQPLRAGAQFLGTGYPLTMSPSSRAMTAAAGFMTGDTIYLWSGDQRTGAAGFTTYRFQEAVSESWGNTTKGDGSTQGLFEPYRASYLWSGSQRLGWQIMLP